MKTLVQEYLAANPVESLTERYAIAVKRHPEFPNLVMLKYDQIGSPMAEPIVQECRGIILDESDGWRVVSYPFRKFFNHGEGHAAAVDWPTARVYEKLDGSLMTLYWYAGAWRVASNGTPDAGGPVLGHRMTFADLFWKTWEAMGYRLPASFGGEDGDPPPCFMFELMTPHNRVVVPHAAARLVLIGVRDLETLEEVPVEPVAASIGWECVRSYPLGCIDDCLAAAAALNPMEAEGYVVCDGRFGRVKVKSPQYVALAHLKENFTARRMLEVVRSNESTEFLAYFPEMRPVHDRVRERFDALCAEVDASYASLRHVTDRKAFALDAVKCRCSSALFAMRDGKAVDARGFFAKATAQAVERAVDLNGIELADCGVAAERGVREVA